MDAGNRAREIYSFFSAKTQLAIRRKYMNKFGYTEQTFRNKIAPGTTSQFSPEEMLWLEQIAEKYGVPPAKPEPPKQEPNQELKSA